MNQILKQVGRARRRLIASIFLQSLSLAALVCFSIALIGMLVPKIWYLQIENQLWIQGWLIGATVLSVVIALIRTWLNVPSTNDSATEVDLRLKLKERLSSALQLPAEYQLSPIGAALLNDAEKIAERIDVRDAFPISIAPRHRWGWLPVVLTCATILIPNAIATTTSAKSADKGMSEETKDATKKLLKLTEEKLKEAESKEELDEEEIDFLKRVEQKLEDLQKNDKIDEKKVLSDLNTLKDEMEKRREQLGNPEALKKNLAGLKELTDGPAEKVADAIKDGDLDKASEELEKLAENLENGNLSPEQSKQLEKQMEQMNQAIEEAIAEHEQAKNELQKQIEQAEQAGNVQKAAELRKELESKKADDASMKQMSDLAKDMQKAKDALKNGDTKEAKKAMQDMKKKLEKMAEKAKQNKDLDKMLQNAKECKECANGKEGDSDKEGGKGQGKSNKMSKWSKSGRGEGPGAGERPEEETETKTVDSQVRNDVEQGENSYGGKVGGANRKGVTKEQVQQEVQLAEVEDAKALETIVLPKKQRDQTREYFDALRENK